MRQANAKSPSRRPFVYRPKRVEAIVMRPFAFEFPDDLDRIWAPIIRCGHICLTVSR